MKAAPGYIYARRETADVRHPSLSGRQLRVILFLDISHDHLQHLIDLISFLF